MSRMHSSSLAPLLSATLRRVSCWIIGNKLPQRPGGLRKIEDVVGSFRFLHDLYDAPALLLRDRPRLDDPDQVAHAALVLLVVSLESDALLHRLLVEGMSLQQGHLDDDCLVHLVRDHIAGPDLALAPVGRRSESRPHGPIHRFPRPLRFRLLESLPPSPAPRPRPPRPVPAPRSPVHRAHAGGLPSGCARCPCGSCESGSSPRAGRPPA